MSMLASNFTVFVFLVWLITLLTTWTSHKFVVSVALNGLVWLSVTQCDLVMFGARPQRNPEIVRHLFTFIFIMLFLFLYLIFNG